MKRKFVCLVMRIMIMNYFEEWLTDERRCVFSMAVTIVEALNNHGTTSS